MDSASAAAVAAGLMTTPPPSNSRTHENHGSPLQICCGGSAAEYWQARSAAGQTAGSRCRRSRRTYWFQGLLLKANSNLASELLLSPWIKKKRITDNQFRSSIRRQPLFCDRRHLVNRLLLLFCFSNSGELRCSRARHSSQNICGELIGHSVPLLYKQEIKL